MPLDDATWAQVRLAYCTSTLTTDAICEQFGISSPILYKRRRTENWPLRGRNWTPPDTAAPPAEQNKTTPQPTPRATRAALIIRLYRAIDLKLTQMEKLKTKDEDTSSADHERETRALTSLVRNFERVTELHADPSRQIGKSNARSTRAVLSTAPAHTAADAAAPANAATAAANPADAERLRRDIAQRLERIMGKGNPPGDAG